MPVMTASKVNSKKASRTHLRLERRDNQIILVDESTNGTHIEMQSGEKIILRREDMPIFGKGILSLGSPHHKNPGALIHFRCIL